MRLNSLSISDRRPCDLVERIKIWNLDSQGKRKWILEAKFGARKSSGISDKAEWRKQNPEYVSGLIKSLDSDATV